MTRQLLIVDDNEVFRRVLSREISQHGREVLQAGDSETALAIAHDKGPAEVVLDLRLGDDSGLLLLPRLVDALAGRRAAHDAKIVLLTGYASIGTAVEAVKRGAYNYLAKPATVAQILAAFNDVEAEAQPEQSDFEPLSVRQLEWEHLQQVLSANDGNVSATARALGMHRRTLQRKLGKKPGSK